MRGKRQTLCGHELFRDRGRLSVCLSVNTSCCPQGLALLRGNSAGMSLRTQRLTWQKQTVHMAWTWVDGTPPSCPLGGTASLPNHPHCSLGRTERVEGREGILGGRCPQRNITRCPQPPLGQPRSHTCPAPTSAQRPRLLRGLPRVQMLRHCPSAACPSPQEGPAQCSARQHFQSTPPVPGRTLTHPSPVAFSLSFITMRM